MMQRSDTILLKPSSSFFAYSSLHGSVNKFQISAGLRRAFCFSANGLMMARYCDVCIIMKKGRIMTIGDPKKVITPQLIRDVYEVDARVGLDEDGEIYVLPKRYIGAKL